MKKITYFTFFTLFTVCFGYTQNNFLIKKWKMLTTIDCNQQKSESNIDKWDVSFNSTNNVEINIRKTSIDIQKKYVLNGENLFIGNQKFIIKKLTQDSLILSSASGKCFDYSFVNEKIFNQNQMLAKNQVKKSQKNKFFIYKNDTVYFPNKNNFPKLKNYSNYNDYFIKVLPINTDFKECVTQFKFIVKCDGTIEDTSGSSTCDKISNKKIEKVIEKMKKLWSPMLIDNKPVNSLVRVKVNHTSAIIIN